MSRNNITSRWDEYKAQYPHVDDEAIQLLKKADEKMLDLYAQLEWPEEILEQLKEF
jgi:hypothetical protein